MPHLQPGVHVFGATLPERDVEMNVAACRLIAIYNQRGVFSNAGDTLSDLEQALLNRLDDVDIRLHGVVALFEARAR